MYYYIPEYGEYVIYSPDGDWMAEVTTERQAEILISHLNR